VIAIDPGSSVPPFEQVRTQFAAQISDGSLAAGTRLPTVRQLADDLGLAANTVARAYRDLETAGLVETRGRNGTVVTAAGNKAREKVQREAERFAGVVRAAGLDHDEALRIIRGALGA
jgi:DNA-binding transcriptional regulator YhcF (GntR family)